MSGRLLRCRRCPRMQSTPVSGGAIVSDVMIIGQAPGPREPTLKRPFAHTAGKTLFRWFEQFCGMDEAAVRSRSISPPSAVVSPAKILAAPTASLRRMRFATVRCGWMTKFGFCSRGSLFPSADWRSCNSSTVQNWKTNWPQISRRACGPPLRPDSLAASFRRVALAQDSTRQSTHRARPQIDRAPPCNPSTGLIWKARNHEFSMRVICSFLGFLVSLFIFVRM